MPAHDVLIIGAGLAGQRAALAAASAGATVAIMSKVHPVRSHSNAAAGAITAPLNPDDSWESHAFDTVKGSDYLGDQDAIEIMCREAPDEVLWLEHQGVTFHRNEQGPRGTRAAGGHPARELAAGPGGAGRRALARSPGRPRPPHRAGPARPPRLRRRLRRPHLLRG